MSNSSQADAGYSVLCANRDEFLSRPTSGAHWHAFEAVSAAHSPEDANSPTAAPDATVLSGRDLVAGGTWLGANTHGRIGLL